jgi:hypothetical protein
MFFLANAFTAVLAFDQESGAFKQFYLTFLPEPGYIVPKLLSERSVDSADLPHTLLFRAVSILNWSYNWSHEIVEDT